jgi:redox-sensitive bicupin YhaK (pirin superfamily)
MKGYRTLREIIDARATSDGDGVKIRRVAGKEILDRIDPFLLIDEIRSEDGADYIGGFPPHPHRGFETITYMLEGAMRHRDHLGNEGVIGSGDVQWMTAGSGVIHSEMPEQSDGLLHGFQLWLNLPASEKMKPAAYQEFSASRIPVVELAQGGRVRVIAGQLADGDARVTGPVANGTTRPGFLDLELRPGGSWELATDSDQSVLVLVFRGSTTQLGAGQMGVYGPGDSLSLTASGQGARALVLLGTPLREPISQYGPFVMNTAEEIEQTISDYKAGRLVA